MKIRSVGAELFHADGRTDRRTEIMKLIVIRRNLTAAPYKEYLTWISNCLPYFTYSLHVTRGSATDPPQISH